MAQMVALKCEKPPDPMPISGNGSSGFARLFPALGGKMRQSTNAFALMVTVQMPQRSVNVLAEILVGPAGDLQLPH